MGLGSRIFIVNDDESLNRLSMAKFERLFRRNLDERLLSYAGKRVRYAHVVLEIENRKPKEVALIQCAYMYFDADGRIDWSSMEKEMQLGVQMVAPIPIGSESTNIVDARHRFARKRFDDRYRWKLSTDVKDAIFKEIFKKHDS
jgi:hypothetical protein